MAGRSLLIAALLSASAVSAQPDLESMAVRIDRTSREYAFTNKAEASYIGESNGRNTPGWQGFTVSGFRFLDDYAVKVDGVPLDRKTCTAIVYPDYLLRKYPNGITEELRIVDSLALIAVVLHTPHPSVAEISPLLSDAGPDSTCVIDLERGSVLIARKKHLQRSEKENYPVWLAFSGPDFTGKTLPQAIGFSFSPASFVSQRGTTHVLAVAVADGKEEARTLAAGYELRAAKFAQQRRTRMERLLASSSVSTGLARFDRALAWAKLSLDALIMNQGTRGIFAGLPWFNNYWGRDTFIALPGATLVTGRFRLAREILRSFAQFQQTDSLSTDYGRIPNLVTISEKAYNTADGTPRFIMMAREYIERSGDSTFMLEVYPDVLRSIEGTLKHHVDADGFLVHGDAETWMDAVGPDGPWSPRGNRANDIQALWAEQLRAGVWFATKVGDPVSAQRWERALRKLEANFARLFIERGMIADHLRPDGSRDMKVRPNQIFCGSLVSDSMQALITRAVTNQLTYRYGVASLSQDDPGFHPYHEHPPFYPKDAAYHNGTVWTWLQGPLISSLCKFGEQNLAWDLTASSTRLLLERGAVGTLPELLDAVPIPPATEPRLSGTFSQAWSLAEYIRNFYDDYLGVRVNRLSGTILLRPRLPRSIQHVRAQIDLEGETLTMELRRSAHGISGSVALRNLQKPYRVMLNLPAAGGASIHSEFILKSSRPVQWSAQGRKIIITPHASALLRESRLVAGKDFSNLLKPLTFLLPVIRKNLPALRGPGYRLLSHAEVKRWNPKASMLFDVPDPAGDDAGNGHYRYPLSPSFVPGSLDIIRATVSYDTSSVYFTLKFSALSNPGWHPEYGFQLTMAAIALREPGSGEPARREIGHQSDFWLDEAHAYQRLILVGGGIQVEDNRGKILAAYVPAPADVSHPLGSAREATIRFAIPISLLGRPDRSWSFTVLVGAQDDHGGAGIGEFRAVRKVAGEWNGGGRDNPEESNVYDILTSR